MYKGLIDKYRKYLPVSENTEIVTLNEGNTPLIKADNLAKKIGLECNLYLKFEGCNPTGSFKDRGMTLAVTKAKEDGSNAIICASTGNTSDIDSKSGEWEEIPNLATYKGKDNKDK